MQSLDRIGRDADANKVLTEAPRARSIERKSHRPARPHAPPASLALGAVTRFSSDAETGRSDQLARRSASRAPRRRSWPWLGGGRGSASRDSSIFSNSCTPRRNPGLASCSNQARFRTARPRRHLPLIGFLPSFSGLLSTSRLRSRRHPRRSRGRLPALLRPTKRSM